MNKLILPAIAISIAMVSAPVFADYQEIVTRAQVKAELVALQEIGYQMTGEDPSYPSKLQAALMKIRAADKVSDNGGGDGMASMPTSDSGRRIDMIKGKPPIYRGR
ncbi:hypothetical protein WK09_06055 [Burkholderia ubonensis]|uniref:DUF4148 domain-containing protein n=1 Tax=Burkholderia ubonensis TaxID=101571 RepID=UPI0007591407|nr:DUF4148 domain-containing protein [Burkholderia ubonensis]KVQ97603.1 hypothetical protein WK09_06055 [Burkholderia ubonensis]